MDSWVSAIIFFVAGLASLSIVWLATPGPIYLLGYVIIVMSQTFLFWELKKAFVDQKNGLTASAQLLFVYVGQMIFQAVGFSLIFKTVAACRFSGIEALASTIFIYTGLGIEECLLQEGQHLVVAFNSILGYLNLAITIAFLMRLGRPQR